MSATSTSESSAIAAPSPPPAASAPPSVLRLPRGKAVVAGQTRPRWWGELLVVAWLAWLYDAVTNLAPAREAVALAHGRSILSFEQSLHIDPEAALNRWLVHHHTLGAISSYYYDNAHFVVTLGLLGWLWWQRADIYRPLRNTLVVINLLGLLVFWLCPVAPPRMLVGTGFSDVVAASHTFGSWHTGSLAADADQFGAMPSLHLAWAAWCGLAIWRMSPRRWSRTIAVLYPMLTALAVLATGNHYLLDVLAGLLTCALAAMSVQFASTLRGRWHG
ncbi:MAG TPA: phosphatase PAP2 family protein [Solirubrobacteraceae bacterium]|nr:phosphatase PAP2 family protein [Solirubrobacteraceae bacterium]